MIPELDPNPTFTLTQLPSIYSKKNFKILVPYTNLYGIKNGIRFSLSGSTDLLIKSQKSKWNARSLFLNTEKHTNKNKARRVAGEAALANF